MDLHGIDLNLLVAFDALMAERSVTRAGVRIGRTQPAMSAALSRLRALLQDELFIRGPDGLQPTPHALDLAEPLGHALAEIQRTLEFTQVFDTSKSTVTLSIGLSEHAAFVVLPKLLAVLRTQAPGIVLRIRNFDHRDEVISLLDSGEADLTVGVPHTPAGRILTEPLFEEAFVCVFRKDHPQAAAELTLDAFLQMSHLLVSPENERFGMVDAALGKLGLRRRLALTLPQMYAAPPLVASSDLIATLMKGVVEASGYRERLHVMKPPLELGTAKFDMAWHRRNDVHPAQRWLREVIGSLFENSPPRLATVGKVGRYSRL
ncbi:LysR family transcriptional regulator [Agrobacterium rosae]|uniref:LysR family transcriptional regulator n=1 Tax=Agrobacterium rosae TaxID=1972867 RepID=A0AAE5VQJ4_9HYPH|nr:LysR family transcriptional regulator [Agrobacterium rosae]KAA3509668.1 LysR family transcriptional regulator [Agrobacterium rosae]KAA3516569.1 LysR family transcriptional regulator [Agrobacterium rosae]MCM2435090.1 LysR family transcriptional regulator [Agrobacterium rosae]MDX8330687.1 LysR family transcriptional regulator [Agrobacterium rosae]MQB50377.1 LysR family transcriptional regulator [Agrobacterium rosae]